MPSIDHTFYVIVEPSRWDLYRKTLLLLGVKRTWFGLPLRYYNPFYFTRKGILTLTIKGTILRAGQANGPHYGIRRLRDFLIPFKDGQMSNEQILYEFLVYRNRLDNFLARVNLDSIDFYTPFPPLGWFTEYMHWKRLLKHFTLTNEFSPELFKRLL